MKRLKIELELKVPDESKWIAVDEDGIITISCSQKLICFKNGYWSCINHKVESFDEFNGCRVVNWKDTLTELSDKKQ